MRTLRCLARGAALREGAEFDLPEEEGRHLAQVLRARAGGMVEVLDGRGGLAVAEVLEAGKSRVRVTVRSLSPPEPPPARRIELAPALTRTDAFEDMLHRGVELGMTGLWPIVADHSVVDLDGRRAAARLERWGRIAGEALKQCERRWLPELDAAAPLEVRLARTVEAGLVPIALVERDAGAPALSALAVGLRGTGVLLLAGPEGGWSARERKLLQDRARPVSLGGAILRTETSCLAALALVSL